MPSFGLTYYVFNLLFFLKIPVFFIFMLFYYIMTFREPSIAS